MSACTWASCQMCGRCTSAWERDDDDQDDPAQWRACAECGTSFLYTGSSAIRVVCLDCQMEHAQHALSTAIADVRAIRDQKEQ